MQRMKRAFALLVLLLAACAKETPIVEETKKPTTPPPASAAEAREMIAASAEFGDHEFTDAGFSLPVSGAAMSEPAKIAARELAAAGWLAIDGAGDLSLTGKSRSDKRFILRPNGLLDLVPLAKKEMGNVTAMRTNPDGTAEADFDWRWIPNDVGASFKTGVVHDRLAAPQQATATLIWDGTKWSVLSIRGR